MDDSWLDTLLDEHGNANYQAGKKYGHASDNLRNSAKKEAKQAIQAELIETYKKGYVDGAKAELLKMEGE